MGDIYYNSVELLLHMDGANNGTTFTDSSTNTLTVTRAGATLPVTVTAVKKYGTASLSSASAGGSVTGGHLNITLPSTVGTGEFTLEAWVRSADASISHYILDNRANSTFTSNTTASGTYYLSVNSSGIVRFVYGATPNSIVSTNAISSNTWHHVAITRDSSNNTRVFLDGNLEATATCTENFNNAYLNIGSNNLLSLKPQTYLDDVRLTFGVCRYTESFTVPSAAFPDEGESYSAVLSSTLANCTTSFAATNTPNITSALASTLANCTADFAATNTPNITATLAPTLANCTADFAATHIPAVSADIASTLAGITASIAATSTVNITAALASTLEDCWASATASFSPSISAALASTLSGCSASIVAKQVYTGALSSTLAGCSASFVAGLSVTTVELTWPAWVCEATGESRDGTATLTWPARQLTAYGGGSASLVWPARTLTASGTLESIGVAALEWPARVLTASGLTGGVGTAELVWPTRTLTAYGGGSATLTWPTRTLTATGTLENVGTAALTWPARVLTATGLTGGVGTATLTWPTRTLTAEGLTGGVGVIALQWPTRVLTATGSGSVTETTYAINLTTGAVTQLLLGAFEKLVTAHGRLYGLRSGALVRLDGDLDGATTIPATIRFSPQQFGTLQAKRLDGHIYLNLRENDGVTLTVVQDETTSWDYQTATDTAPALGTHRVKVGRGITFHSLGLVLKNRAGGRLDVGGLELPVLPLSRKSR